MVQLIWAGIKDIINQQANGNLKIIKDVVRISPFLSDHFSEESVISRKLLGSVVAPFAADPTKNAYLASAPDL